MYRDVTLGDKYGNKLKALANYGNIVKHHELSNGIPHSSLNIICTTTMYAFVNIINDAITNPTTSKAVELSAMLGVEQNSSGSFLESIEV